MKRVIFKKWTLTIVLVVSIAFIIVFMSTTIYFYQTLRKQTIYDEQQNLKQTATQLQYIQMEVENLTKQIIVNDDITYNLMRDENQDKFTKLVIQDNMRRLLMSYANLNDNYLGIIVLTKDNVVYSSDQYLGGFDTSQDWYQDFVKNNQKSGYTKIHKITVGQSSNKWDAISYIMRYYLRDSNISKEGQIIVNINLDQLILRGKLNKTLLSGYKLFDGHGNVILEDGSLSVDYEDIKSLESGTSYYEGKLLIKETLFGDNWCMVSEISDKKIWNKLSGVVFIFVAVYVVVMILLTLILLMFIKHFTKPIETLYRAALSVQNKVFDNYVEVQTKDELETLANTFNQMLDSIQENIKQIVMYEQEKKNMELDRLMLQINPHFIYNTLNTIVYMAQIKGEEDIITYTNAFISLLQDTLQTKGPFVTLQFELQNIKQYLILLSYRYSGQFEIEYDIDDSILDCMVPSVILQPLVENAVFHGLATREDKGILRIEIKKEESNVLILVIDNGAGMSKEVLAHVTSMEQDLKRGMRKIGIANVRQRIETVYGEEYGLEISSEPEKGTHIQITVPYQIKKQE